MPTINPDYSKEFKNIPPVKETIKKFWARLEKADSYTQFNICSFLNRGFARDMCSTMKNQIEQNIVKGKNIHTTYGFYPYDGIETDRGIQLSINGTILSYCPFCGKRLKDPNFNLFIAEDKDND